MNQSVLDIYITSTSGTFEIPDVIPNQTLTLKSYRIEFDSVEKALAAKYIKFACDIFGSNSDTGKTIGATGYDYSTSNGLVLHVDNAVVTIQSGLDIQIDMAKELSEGTKYNLFSSDLTGFANLHMVFNYSVSQI